MIRARSLTRLALVVLLAFVPLIAFVPGRAVAASVAAWPRDPQIVVRDVLAKPAYRAAPVSTAAEPKPTLWSEIWTWIKAQLKALFQPLWRAVAASSGAGASIGVALMLAALVGLAFVFVRLALSLVAPGVRARPSATARALAERRSAAEWQDSASAYAARGEYARAIAALFAAALARLDERALVPFDPSRTPGEYRRLVRRVRAEAAPPFDDLSAGFVRAAFSGIPALRSDFESAERAFAGFEPLVVRP